MIPEFREMDFGLFEGKNYQDLQGDARYQTWIDSNGTIPFPEGESREDFIARCRQGFEEMLRIAIAGVIGRNEEDKNAAKQKTMDENLRIAAVVHGGTIMAVCSSFTDGEYFDFQIGNGEGYRCKVTVGQSSGEIYMD